jgi:2-alkyl-3-oxoalkanoate reductase
VVVHCAGLSSPWGTYQEFYQANVLSTLNLLQVAQATGTKRFILISTPSVYFNYQDRFDLKESDPLPDPMVNHYAVTKYQAEQETLRLNRPDFQTIALRPRAIIGAEDAVIFPRVLRAYHEGRLKIVGDGKNVVDLTCVANVIQAVEACLNAPPEAFGEVYNITNGEPKPLWETIGHFLSALDLPPVTKKIPASVALTVAGLNEFIHRYFLGGREPALTRYSVGILSTSMTMNIDKARTKLGYTPVQNTLEGVKEFVTWYQTQAQSR